MSGPISAFGRSLASLFGAMEREVSPEIDVDAIRANFSSIASFGPCVSTTEVVRLSRTFVKRRLGSSVA